jgi:abortive infection bacteriophage resistance protein
MDQELSENIDRLIAKYPVVFKHRDKTTYYDLPNGWYELVDNLCAKLSCLLEEELKTTPDTSDAPLFYVFQIKEKFGGLRFYFTMNTENENLYKQVQTLIDIAEDSSYSLCQETGTVGTLCKKNSHYQTYCPQVCAERNYTPIGNLKK